MGANPVNVPNLYKIYCTTDDIFVTKDSFLGVTNMQVDIIDIWGDFIDFVLIKKVCVPWQESEQLWKGNEAV